MVKKSKSQKKGIYDYIIYLVWLLFFFLIIWDLFNVPVRSLIWGVSLWLLIYMYFKTPHIPRKIYVLFCILALSNVFGEVIFRFFYTIEFYDKIIHFSSSFILCFLFYYALRNKIKDRTLLLLFSGLLVVSIGATWEIIEYLFDTYFGTLMVGVYVDDLDQIFGVRFMSPLDDTMFDMILNFLGSVLFFVGGLVIGKKKTN